MNTDIIKISILKKDYFLLESCIRKYLKFQKTSFFLFLITKINSNLCEKKQRVVVLIYLINKNVILLDFFDKVVMSILIYISVK